MMPRWRQGLVMQHGDLFVLVQTYSGRRLAQRRSKNALTHRNFARLGLFGLRQYECDHAVVLHLGADLTLVDPIGNLETARIVADVVFGVDRLHSLIFGEVNSTDRK